MRRFLTLGAILIAGNGSIALSQFPSSQEPPRPGSTTLLGLDELLRRWERQGSAPRLEVTFSQLNRSRHWDDERNAGRLILGTDERVRFDSERLVGGGKTPIRRLLRNGDRLYQYLFETKTVFVIAVSSLPKPSGKEQGLASEILSACVWPLSPSSYEGGDAPPFLFRLNVAKAKADYRLELVKETAADAMIKLTPLRSREKFLYDCAIILIDKSHWLPKEAHLVMNGGKAQMVFGFTILIREDVVDDDCFEFKPLEGWKVLEDEDPL